LTSLQPRQRQASRRRTRTGTSPNSVDSNEGGHLLQSDRGHHSNLMAAS
jgi:hypothetical protein